VAPESFARGRMESSDASSTPDPDDELAPPEIDPPETPVEPDDDPALLEPVPPDASLEPEELPLSSSVDRLLSAPEHDAVATSARAGTEINRSARRIEPESWKNPGMAMNEQGLSETVPPAVLA
jgi:hypothetical protein